MGSEITRNRAARAAAIAALAAASIAVSGCSGGGGGDDANLVSGKQLFVEKCGSCHALARAGTKGAVGPDLDDAFAVARAESFGDESIRGAIHGQILNPAIGSAMPAGLVKGEDANDVAAYIASAVARGGEDSGRLADAVKKAGGGKPAVAENGVLSIAADPGGQLAYATDVASAAAGPIEIQMPNESTTPHDLQIEGTDIRTPVVKESVGKGSGSLKAGEYVFFCSVTGHRAGGMEGKLTVK